MEKRGYPRWAHFLSLFSFPYLSQKCNWNVETVYIYIGILKKEEKDRVTKIELATDFWKQEKRLMKIFFLRW